MYKIHRKSDVYVTLYKGIDYYNHGVTYAYKTKCFVWSLEVPLWFHGFSAALCFLALVYHNPVTER